jgi:hypothetical protein
VDDREAPTRLRSLVYQGDGPGLVAILSQEPWPADALQLIGDGLLAAVRDDIGGSAKLARTCVNARGELSWRRRWKRLLAMVRRRCCPRWRWTWRKSP